MNFTIENGPSHHILDSDDSSSDSSFSSVVESLYFSFKNLDR